jgi:gluconolactonase
MELSKAIIGALTLLGLISSCSKNIDTNQEKLSSFNEVIENIDTIKSSDFTAANVFTDGIEGPAIDSEGNLFIVNFSKQGTIGFIDKNGIGEVYLTLPEGSIGNSIQFDADDNMYVADYAGHNIYKISKSKVVDTLIHCPEFTQPNDIALSSNGCFYASDPKWSDESGQLWLIKKNNKAILLEDSMGTTNGIALSPNETNLYVNESVQKNVWVYDILENGELTNKKLFHKFDDFGMDGMKFDAKGNLNIARYGAGVIAVLSPEGELVKKYLLQGDKPTNLVFSKDGKTIFVTMQGRKCVEKIILK